MEAALNSPFGRTVLGPTALRIGRAPDNTLVINDPQSSSHHAEIAPGFDGNSYQVTDLNSTNGTFVNEQRLVPSTPRQLNAGDVIRIGATNFSYEVSGFGYQATVAASAPSYEPTVAASAPGYQPTVAAAPDPFAQPVQAPTAYENFGMPAQPPYTPQPAYPDYLQAQPAYPQPAYPQPGYPQPTYPQPGYPQPGGFGQLAQKNRTGLIAAIVVILFLVVGGGAFYYFQVQSTPTKTLQAYCNDFKTGNAQDMYNLLSTSNQQRTSVTQIQQAINLANAAGGIKDCTVSNVQENGSTATGTVTFTLNNGQTGSETDTLVNENGTWKFDSSRGNS